MTEFTRITCSFEETFQLGRDLAKGACSGDIFALWGELGAGKTTFTRGFARGLGVPENIPITSPTFTLVNEYDGLMKLYHIDLYRISSEYELDTIPLREVLYGSGVSLIEWPDRLGRYLPYNRWDIIFEIVDDDLRKITVRRRTDSS